MLKRTTKPGIIHLVAAAAMVLAAFSVISPTTTALAVSVSVGCSGSNQTLQGVTAIHSSGALLFSKNDVVRISASGPFNISLNSGGVFAAGTAWSYKVPSTGLYTFQANATSGIATTFIVQCANAGPVPAPFVDGRCNQEADQAVAVYPDGFGGYDFYAVNVGVGYFAFDLSAKTLVANSAGAGAYLITQNLGVPVYRMPDGSLQTQRAKPDGKLYAFNWMNCGWAVG